MSWLDVVGSFIIGGIAIATPAATMFTASKPAEVNNTPVVLPTAKAEELPSIPLTPTESQRIKIKVSVTRPEDLKIRQGDQLTKGQVIADRDLDRSRLLSAKRELERNLKLISGQDILSPPEPKPVPKIAKLPLANFGEEQAAIAAARLRLSQAQREYDAQVANLNAEPAGESAAAERARVEVEKVQSKLQTQEVKIEQVKDLQNLPASVLYHEQEVFKQMQTELAQAESDLRMARGKLTDTANSRKEKLAQLQIELEQARANVILSEARLDAAKSRRHQMEYEHSITIARRTEEENQSKQIHARQIQEVGEQRRNKDFQLAQLRARIQDVDNQLSAIAVVKSPVNGVVRRVKNLGQVDNALSYELTVVSSGNSSSFIKPAGGNLEGTDE